MSESMFFDSWIPPKGYYAALRYDQAPYLIATVSQVRYHRGRIPAILRFLGWIGSDHGHMEIIIWRSDPVDCKSNYQLIMQKADQIADKLSSIDPNGEKDVSWAKDIAIKEVKGFDD